MKHTHSVICYNFLFVIWTFDFEGDTKKRSYLRGILVLNHLIFGSYSQFISLCNNMKSEYIIAHKGILWLLHLYRDTANIISWLQWVHKSIVNCIACWQCHTPHLTLAILILRLLLHFCPFTIILENNYNTCIIFCCKIFPLINIYNSSNFLNTLIVFILLR